jgi:hypothetical protein
MAEKSRASSRCVGNDKFLPGILTTKKSRKSEGRKMIVMQQICIISTEVAFCAAAVFLLGSRTVMREFRMLLCEAKFKIIC